MYQRGLKKNMNQLKDGKIFCILRKAHHQVLQILKVKTRKNINVIP